MSEAVPKKRKATPKGEVIPILSKRKYSGKNLGVRVQSVIEIHIVYEDKKTAWVHTHGMAKYELPELEIRDVPSYFVVSAGQLLNSICDAVLNDGEGRTLETRSTYLFDDIGVMFAKASPMSDDHKDHYKEERWVLQSLPVQKCEGCGEIHPIGGDLPPEDDDS